jgi:endoglucanase
MNDMIDIFEAYGHHWSIWTYKDIGMMGAVLVDSESEWMRRIQPVRTIKTRIRCDSWIERTPGPIDPSILRIAEYAMEVIPYMSQADLLSKLQCGLQDGILAQALLPAFVEQFRNISEVQIDSMMQSFAFKNCRPRQDLIKLLKRKLGTPVEDELNF